MYYSPKTESSRHRTYNKHHFYIRIILLYEIINPVPLSYVYNFYCEILSTVHEHWILLIQVWTYFGLSMKF